MKEEILDRDSKQKRFEKPELPSTADLTASEKIELEQLRLVQKQMKGTCEIEVTLPEIAELDGCTRFELDARRKSAKIAIYEML